MFLYFSGVLRRALLVSCVAFAGNLTPASAISMPSAARLQQNDRGRRGQILKSATGIEAGQENVRPLSDLVIVRNLGKMNDSSYLGYNPNKTVEENAVDSFNHFMDTLDLWKEFTTSEQRKFNYRFTVKMEEQAKRIKDLQKRAETWEAALRDTFERQKPAVTKSVVDALNAAGLGWTAQDPPDMENVAAEDVARLSGIHLTDGEVDMIGTKKDECQKHRTNTSDGTASLLSTGYAHYFDARDQWPECKNVIGNVEDYVQGQCGSCWAMASASAVSSRLCIETKGAFSGPSAALSAGYLTSCDIKQNGCRGGDVRTALQWIGQNGVPTGGSGSNHMTCVPYFGNGDSLKHFADPTVAPPCPTSCTSIQYPRSLDQDLFKMRGLENSDYATICDATKAIRNGGPVVIIFAVTQEFMAYKDGTYSPATSNILGYHATVAIGYAFEYEKGPQGFIRGVNSWGSSWGMNGTFKIDTAAVLGFVVPGGVVKGVEGLVQNVSYEAASANPFPVPGGNPPPVALWGKWSLSKGQCSLTDDGCMQSPNFPDGYGSNESCTFIAEEGSPPISVESFNTEQDADVLNINGVSYSGGTGPQGIVPKGEIIWYSDESVNGAGWKLCPHTNKGSSLQESVARGRSTFPRDMFYVFMTLSVFTAGAGLTKYYYQV